MQSMKTIEAYESQVRGYCRQFPAMFDTAIGSYMFTSNGERYIDFFDGAGALNYGHNNTQIQSAVTDYLNHDGIVHSLDMATETKSKFIERFQSDILQPRSLKYKIQFPGPTGTNAIEAAIKLARKVTGRQGVVAFTNAFHGMTLGSLALTANLAKRAGAGVALNNVIRMPFDGFMKGWDNSIAYLEKMLIDSGSGIDLPAAIVVETVQAEGGINCASKKWLQKLVALASRLGILLIVDDIQTGCGRTGKFFSFEEAGIRPDMVCLSKSISGIGLPLSLVLIHPNHDIWNPGEHNGTFRGQNLSFVAATEALSFWSDDQFSNQTLRKGKIVNSFLKELVLRHSQDEYWQVRGRGLIQGLDLGQCGLGATVSREAFSRGLIIESCGATDCVVKLLPPLTISDSELEAGLDILQKSILTVCRSRSTTSYLPINAQNQRVDGIANRS